MTKTELVKSMQAHTGSGFITRIQLAGYMGYKNPTSVAKYLHGLERVDKKYFIPDVADSILTAARG